MFLSEQDRVVQLMSDIIFNCNTNFLGTAFGNETYNYLFAYDDAYHGYDVPFTFFDPTASSSTYGSWFNSSIAAQMQGYITSFVLTGKPAAKNASPFPEYGKDATVRVLNNTGPADMVDPAANPQCDWWQLALYQ
jgi:acetylcholinesterase